MRSVDVVDPLSSLRTPPNLTKSFLKCDLKTFLDLWTLFVPSTAEHNHTGSHWILYLDIWILSEKVSWANPINAGPCHWTPPSFSPNLFSLYNIIQFQYNYYICNIFLQNAKVAAPPGICNQVSSSFVWGFCAILNPYFFIRDA